MESLRQIGAGFLLGFLSIAAVLGGFALSQAEGGEKLPVLVSPSSTLQILPVEALVTSLPTIPILTNTPLPSQPVSVTETIAPTATSAPTQTPPPPPVSCLPPSGWLAIQLQGYDTLLSLAQRYRTSVEALKQANCLFSDQLVIGSFLYVPPQPTATFVPCGAPSSWIYYTVVSGDTLFSIGTRYLTTVPELQKANCLGSSTYIQAGARIKVPNVVPIFPTATFTLPTSTVTIPTATASRTLAPATATLVPPSATLTSLPPTEVPPTATLVPPSATPVTPVPSTSTPEPTTAPASTVVSTTSPP